MLPTDAYKDNYQPGNCPSINEAILRLMLSDKTREEKKKAVIAVLQRGIDMIHWQILGNVQPESGHQPCLLAIPSFTAALLNIKKYVDFVKTLPQKLGNERYSRKDFHEDCMLHPSSWNPDVILWGEIDSEDNYWRYVIKGEGNRSIVDPYGYIDGGKSPEPSYQAICINGYKGEVLCAHLMPALREVWYDSIYIRMTKYVDRMVQVGKWTQPDICAPAEGVWRGKGPKNGKRCTSAMVSPVDGDTCVLSDSNYKKTFGPDPNNPGKCICDKDSSDGIGRFPQTHGNKNGWQYKSTFVDTMWSVYRKGSGSILKGKSINYREESFELYQHPFNQNTLIRYKISQDDGKGSLKIKVYDILGREIPNFVEEIKKTGTYNIKFSGGRLSAGIYFYLISRVDRGNVYVKKSAIVE
ncbi:MAG: T9SS type A sorting domain-containing protein [Chitinispirillaceae bacterium]|nr:T9SS type A sorting domain-containing protein [Chitinispirillaceae bacterium]